jgi:serine/threonine protein kinase
MCKELQVNNTNSIGHVLSLIAELRALDGCRNVVRWHDDVSFDSQRMRMNVYMDTHGVSLETYLKILGRKFMHKDVFTEISASLIMALKDCHDKGICHRDIRPQNGKAFAGPWMSIGAVPILRYSDQFFNTYPD